MWGEGGDDRGTKSLLNALYWAASKSDGWAGAGGSLQDVLVFGTGMLQRVRERPEAHCSAPQATACGVCHEGKRD